MICLKIYLVAQSILCKEVFVMVKMMERELKRGTLELILLKLLSERDMYGYQISTALEERSGNEFQLKEGTLYPVFYRLEDAGYIEARWETQGRGKPRKYYSLTREGTTHLEELLAEWKDFVRVVNTLLGSRGLRVESCDRGVSVSLMNKSEEHK